MVFCADFSSVKSSVRLLWGFCEASGLLWGFCGASVQASVKASVKASVRLL